MSSRARSRTGQVLGKSYRIERLLGVGSLGAVYVARHVRTGALCAVKLLHRKLLPDSEVYQKLVEETRALSMLRHPHILLFSDHDQDESGGMYLVMELLEGETLHQRLQQRGSLTVAQVLELSRQVGGALHAAHRVGVVHRNLRPENIFLVRHDMGDHVVESVRVMDFGLGRLRRPPQLEGPGPLLGVSQYTAPETIAGAPPDGRADQWALAVVLYRALAGRLPFDGDSLREVVRQMMEQAPVPLQQVAPEVPPALANAIARGLQRDPRERFDTVMDLVRAACERPTLPSGALGAPSGPLASLVSEELPRPVAIPAPPPPRAGRTLLLAGVALVLLASGGATAWLLHERAEGLASSLTSSGPAASQAVLTSGAPAGSGAGAGSALGPPAGSGAGASQAVLTSGAPAGSGAGAGSALGPPAGSGAG
ncbi:MAG: serine/threonine protein kinase, partial [Myxococcota bacterium]|nr:serine/threonine protein kinase [Myxococcota bacterium]